MKIFYITNVRIPTEKAHGIQIMKMCEAFVNAGVSLTLVVPRRLNSIKEDPFEYYDVKKNFSLVRLPCLDLTFFGKYGFYFQSVTFSISAFLYVFVKRVDILYTRDVIIASFSRIKKIKTVYEAHNWPQSKEKSYLRLLRRVYLIVSNTQGTAREFEKRNVTNTFVARNGVDVEKFTIQKAKEELRKELNIPVDKKVVMYIGKFYVWKGVDVLAKAWRNIAEKNKNLYLVLIGGHLDDQKRIKDIIGNTPNVLFVEHIPHKKVPLYLHTADVLILPNIPLNDESIKYTSPIKMFEYLSTGRPIIASDLPSIREVLNEKNAILVKAGDAEALGTAIVDLFSSDEKINNYSVIDTEIYSWNSRAKKIMDRIKFS